jgi:hypothetical protein
MGTSSARANFSMVSIAERCDRFRHERYSTGAGSTLFDVALREILFFAECAKPVAYNHGGIIQNLESYRWTISHPLRRKTSRGSFFETNAATTLPI